MGFIIIYCYTGFTCNNNNDNNNNNNNNNNEFFTVCSCICHYSKDGNVKREEGKRTDEPFWKRMIKRSIDNWRRTEEE